MNRFTVEPVPTPIVTPPGTSSSAASAARRLFASASVAIIAPRAPVTPRNDCARVSSGHSLRIRLGGHFRDRRVKAYFFLAAFFLAFFFAFAMLALQLTG
jgi:hypothetical protein